MSHNTHHTQILAALAKTDMHDYLRKKIVPHLRIDLNLLPTEKEMWAIIQHGHPGVIFVDSQLVTADNQILLRVTLELAPNLKIIWLPPTLRELKFTFKTLLRQTFGQFITGTIGVFTSGGGVGGSSIALALTDLLSLHSPTLLIDLQPFTPTLLPVWDETQQAIAWGLEHALQQASTPPILQHDKRKSALIPGFRDIDLISQIPSETLTVLLSNLQRQFSVLVLDLGSDPSHPLTQKALALCSTTILVLNSSLPSRLHARRLRNSLHALTDQAPLLIYNQTKKHLETFLLQEVGQSPDVLLPTYRLGPLESPSHLRQLTEHLEIILPKCIPKNDRLSPKTPLPLS